MQVNNEIEEQRIKHDTDGNNRNADTRKTQRIRDMATEIEQKKRENAEYARKQKLDKQQYERSL